MLCHFDSNLTHYFSGKMRRDTALICLNSDDVEEGHIQVNKVARNNLCLKLADLVNVHQCLDITYGKRVSGDIFDMDIRPYFPEDKQSCHYLILDALSEHHFM
jgi:hypothetical protein